MKVEFWKEGLVCIIACALLPLPCLALVITSACGLLSKFDYWSMIIICSLALLLSIFPLFKKGLFSKVILSDAGITLKQGKKVCAFLDWNEITSVKTKSSGITTRYLTFDTGYKSIDIAISQRLYDTVMEVCPNVIIKMQLKDIPQLYMLLQRWLKKQQNEK